MKKRLCLLLILIFTASSLILVKTSYAQVGVTNPAIPSFGVTLETHSNYIPPTYGVDPSTGKAVIITEGYREVEKWVRVEIGGQPFLRYNNSGGQLISLFYNVRWKGNHDASWQYMPPDIRYEDAAEPWASQAVGSLISIGFKGIKGPASGWMELLDPDATQIDFQVEALIGYYTTDDVFVGQASGWSDIQILTIPASTPTPSPTLELSISPTPNTVPYQEPFPTVAVVAFLASVAVVTVGLVICFKKLGGEAELS